MTRVTQMSSGKRNRRRSAVVFLLLALVGAGSLAYTLYDHVRRPSQLLARAQRTAQEMSIEIADAIDWEIREVERQVHDIATRLSSGDLNQSNLRESVLSHLASNAGLYGVAAIYAPASADHPDLYGRYWRRQGSDIILMPLEEIQDYTLPDPGPSPGAERTHWYHVPLERGIAWIEPYYCPLGETLMVTYGERLALPPETEASRAAVAVGDLSLTRLRELLSRFPVGQTGYAFILSEGDRLIAHPNRDLLGLSLDEILQGAGGAGSSEAAILAQVAANRDPPASTRAPAAVTDNTYDLQAERIERAGWSLITVFSHAEIVPTTVAERRSRTAILLSVFPLVVGLFGSLIPRGYRRTRLLALAAVASLAFIVGIGCLWHWALRYPTEIDSQSFPVFDTSMTNAVLSRLLPDGPGAVLGDWQSADRIATGVFIQSAKFLGPYNVAVTGYIWQRFEDDRALDKVPGVILPEAEDLTMTRVASSEGFVRWYFEADLRQSFDYASYPIDREHIWIRLWPANFDESVILVPDFAAYDDVARKTKPGLERDFVLEGWACVATHFSYRANSYRSDFGAVDYVAHNNRPELYFNIDLQRKFIGPFVSDLMPMLVVAVLLFAILLIQIRKDESGLLGFSASTVLSYCAGLFFVLIISHVYVREKLAVPQIIYIEWFYFTMYALLLLLSLNAVRFARGRHMKLFGLDYTEWITLAYWPITLGILFLMTLWTFF